MVCVTQADGPARASVRSSGARTSALPSAVRGATSSERDEHRLESDDFPAPVRRVDRERGTPAPDALREPPPDHVRYLTIWFMSRERPESSLSSGVDESFDAGFGAHLGSRGRATAAPAEFGGPGFGSCADASEASDGASGPPGRRFSTRPRRRPLETTSSLAARPALHGRAHDGRPGSRSSACSDRSNAQRRSRSPSPPRTRETIIYLITSCESTDAPAQTRPTGRHPVPNSKPGLEEPASELARASGGDPRRGRRPRGIERAGSGAPRTRKPHAEI